MPSIWRRSAVFYRAISDGGWPKPPSSPQKSRLGLGHGFSMSAKSSIYQAPSFVSINYSNKGRLYMIRASLGLLLLTLCACASSIMQGFVGQPLQQAMIKYGPPLNAFDMGDGRRAFQWVMNSTYVTPSYATTTGNAYGIGNSVYWTQNTQISGGQPINNRCAYTLFGRWSDSTNSWLIEGFEKPNLMCE